MIKLYNWQVLQTDGVEANHASSIFKYRNQQKPCCRTALTRPKSLLMMPLKRPRSAQVKPIQMHAVSKCRTSSSGWSLDEVERPSRTAQILVTPRESLKDTSNSNRFVGLFETRAHPCIITWYGFRKSHYVIPWFIPRENGKPVQHKLFFEEIVWTNYIWKATVPKTS